MKRILASLALLAATVAAGAQSPAQAPEIPQQQQLIIGAELEDVVLPDEPLPPFVPEYMRSPQKKAVRQQHRGADHGVRFAWGANAGAGIDLSGSEMSCVELAVSVGMRWKALKFFGLGLQADIMVSNSCRSYPIYAQLRTNFHEGPSLLFWDVRGGLSINYLEENLKQTGAYFSTGVGVVLASGARYSSHLIFGYEFRSRSPIETETALYDLKNLHGITARLGVTF